MSMPKRLPKQCSDQRCVCSHQDRGAAGSASVASHAGSLDWSQNGPQQSVTRVPLEHGITVATGPAHLSKQMPSILEDAANLLSPRMRALLMELRNERKKLEEQIDTIYRELAESAKKHDGSRSLLTIPGVGPDRDCTVAAATLPPFRRGATWQSKALSPIHSAIASTMRYPHCDVSGS